MNGTTPFADLHVLADHLRAELQNKKFILLYAYNGTGKTRLSTEFKNLGKKRVTSPTTTETGEEIVTEEGEQIVAEEMQRDTLYFNAFTEDLFSWDNDLVNDRDRVLKLNRDSQFFAGLKELEMDTRIRPLLHRYADFDFRIDPDEWEVTFSKEIARGDTTEKVEDIKISRGEENIFIWCFFLAILQLTLDEAEAYKWVKYVYIDDPISSLDEHNAIVVGNHLVQIYREAKRPVKTVISTHHALFFNVLHYEIKYHLGRPSQYMLRRDKASGGFRLEQQRGDTPQFYHVSALAELWGLVKEEKIKTYHFNVLRSIIEKTAFFHGYEHFSDCIKRDKDDAEGLLHQRFVDILSHGKYSMYEPVEMQDQTRDYFKAILRGFVERHPFNPALVPPEQDPVLSPAQAGVAAAANTEP